LGAPLIRETLIRDALFTNDDEDNAGLYYDYDYGQVIIASRKPGFSINPSC
jgi:hypothetical protein